MVKKIIILIGCICLSANIIVLSQNKCDSFYVFFGSPEEIPKLDIFKFLSENLKYPKTAKKDKLEGEVIIRFWIDSLGNTSEHEIIKSARFDLDEEALRVAQLIKFDKPAMNRGKPIGSCFQLPITFRLNHIDNSQLKKSTKRVQ